MKRNQKHTVLFSISMVTSSQRYGLRIRYVYLRMILLNILKGSKSMSKKDPSKDEALEALDFIVSVLKDHEKDLDRLINELGTITERLGETGEISGKVEKVEDRLTKLQDEITNLITYLSATPSEIPVQTQLDQEQKTETLTAIHGPPVILRCKQWDDFQIMAQQAQTLSYLYRDTEKTFQVDALKNNKIVTYNGELPQYGPILKAWLSKQLDIPEKKILEGILAIS